MEQAAPWQRPRLIRDLGIASFVNTGLFTVVYGMGLLFAAGVQRMPYADFEAMMLPQMRLYAGGEPDAVMLEMMGILHAHGTALMGLMLLRTLGRLVGVLGMWNGRYWGFTVYAVAQLAGIFLPHVVLPWKFLGLGGPLLAMGMTALYGTQRNSLR
ncbi:MAG: hypothetical protein JNL05_08785 [Flavobacteriales bacterium]|nr:hypothetical protein [Flavobacteriales bacterium]